MRVSVVSGTEVLVGRSELLGMESRIDGARAVGWGVEAGMGTVEGRERFERSWWHIPSPYPLFAPVTSAMTLCGSWSGWELGVRRMVCGVYSVYRWDEM